MLSRTRQVYHGLRTVSAPSFSLDFEKMLCSLSAKVNHLGISVRSDLSETNLTNNQPHVRLEGVENFYIHQEAE
jgi:hypothetical protein